MKDVMLDFETFGTGSNACVVQVGACYFDRLTGEIGRQFECNVDAVSAVRSGAHIDASTIYWWLNQSQAARDSILNGERLDIRAAFEALNTFFMGAKYIWSHATFDFVILTETLKRLNIKPSFRYQAARDIRTLVDLANLKFDPTQRDGVHHNGLADCHFQVKYCVAALQSLKK